jgi:hypothetical protein
MSPTTCSYANRETVAKALGIYNAGKEQQTEVKYICVKFVVDDDEMVPFPEFFEDTQNLLHGDLLYAPELLQSNHSIYTIVRNIIAWYVDCSAARTNVVLQIVMSTITVV